MAMATMAAVRCRDDEEGGVLFSAHKRMSTWSLALSIALADILEEKWMEKEKNENHIWQQ